MIRQVNKIGTDKMTRKTSFNSCINSILILHLPLLDFCGNRFCLVLNSVRSP